MFWRLVLCDVMIILSAITTLKFLKPLHIHRLVMWQCNEAGRTGYIYVHFINEQTMARQWTYQDQNNQCLGFKSSSCESKSCVTYTFAKYQQDKPMYMHMYRWGRVKETWRRVLEDWESCQISIEVKTPLRVEALKITNEPTFSFLKLTDLLFVSLLLHPSVLMTVP